MSLAGVQNLLARLYTDPGLQEDFFVDPAQAAREFHLSPAEVETVCQITKFQIRNFAGSLIQKRLSEVRKKLALTSQLLGKQFDRLFYQFVRNERCKGSRKHVGDCFDFSEFIISVAPRGGIEPWVIDLMGYEIVRIRAVYSKLAFRIYVSRYAIKDLMIDMDKNSSLQGPRTRITIGVWIRLLPRKKLWHRLVQLF